MKYIYIYITVLICGGTEQQNSLLNTLNFTTVNIQSTSTTTHTLKSITNPSSHSKTAHSERLHGTQPLTATTQHNILLDRCVGNQVQPIIILRNSELFNQSREQQQTRKLIYIMVFKKNVR